MKLLKCVVLTAGLFVVNAGHAADYKSFCSGVAGWEAGKEIPPAAEYSSLAKAIVSAKEASELAAAPDVAFIDARSEEDRKSGRIPHTLAIVSDSKAPAKHQFSDEKMVVEKLNKHFNTKYQSIAEFKKEKIVLFCNGTKCHRSTFAACSLRNMGFPQDHLYLMLGGFGEWKTAGLPVK